MKKILITAFLIQSLAVFSQNSAKMYTEVKQDTLFYYADNVEVYPISITFTGSSPELENLRSPEPFKLIHVLPPSSSKNKVAAFIVKDKNKGWKIRKMPSFYTLAGDATIKTYDTDYKYDLPFQKGKSFTMHQGYNGVFSHQNENSLDFTMPEGTEIVAAREGKIIQTVQDNNRGCPNSSCANLANYITILHSDGTMAQYLHLKQNGVKVKVGDEVKKGDVIGLSGNTGWSNGPHLHFVCYLPDASKPKQKNTLKTLFRIGDGTKAEFLTEKNTYSKNY